MSYTGSLHNLPITSHKQFSNADLKQTHLLAIPSSVWQHEEAALGWGKQWNWSTVINRYWVLKVISFCAKTALCGLAYPLLKKTTMIPPQHTKHNTSREQLSCKSRASYFQNSQALTVDVHSGTKNSCSVLTDFFHGNYLGKNLNEYQKRSKRSQRPWLLWFSH